MKTEKDYQKKISRLINNKFKENNEFENFEAKVGKAVLDELGLDENLNLKVKENKFTNRFKWEKYRKLENLKYPCVYIIAVSKKNLDNKKFSWIKNIIYIGMTNSKGGLKQRLRQFENTILCKHIQHGGADRVRFDYNNTKDFYVSVLFFKCNNFKKKEDLSYEDYIQLGLVACFEYICFAEFKKRFGELPKYNQSSSKKYSKEKNKNAILKIINKIK